MATFTLTTGTDIFVGGPEDSTVIGTAATLNPSDSLTGGGGTNTLALYGSGPFYVDQLANFTGFKNITLNDGGTLYLGSQTLEVTGYGSGEDILYLGSGATTFLGGSGRNNWIYSSSPSNWNAGDVINGGLLRSANLYLDQSGLGNATYDLTTNTLANINYLIANEFGNALNLTLKINSADAAGVSIFYSNNRGMNDQLVTSDATLDLSHSLVSGFTVASTNTSGTTFVVHDLSTADLIVGGPGQDTILASGFSFTPLDRNYIFANGIEKLIDSNGTYTPNGIVSGGPTIDTLVGQPVNGSAIEVRGTGAADDTVTLYADGGTTPVGTGMVGADGSFDITTSTAFADGSHTLIATQTDATGLASTPSASFVVAVDPSAPTINTLVGQVNGSLAAVVEVKGTGQAGDTVTLYADGATTPLGTGVVAANGSFDIATNVTFAGGSPTLTSTQTDAQDLTSMASTRFAVAFDPNPPAISALGGQPVNDAPIEVKGTGEAGDTVIVYADGGTTAVGSGTVASNGSFDITTSTTFVEGLHSLTATQINAQGLTNTVSANFSVEVDPSAPVISTLVGQPVSGSPIEAKGTAEAGDTVTLYADGGTTAVGSGTVAANGYFDITTSMTFADGSHTLTATQTDAQGLTSPASTSFAFAVGAAVVSVVASPGSGDFNAGNKFTITLDMNEAVKVVGKPTLVLNDGGTASYSATLSSPTALAFTYTVAAAQNALELEITGVNLPSGASIKDSQGNNADLSGAVANLGLQIDTTQPTVSNILVSPNTGDLNAGKTVAITLNMSEAITVLSGPTIRLSDGGIATFDAAHSTSTALAFDYTVATGQNTSDLQLTGVNLPSGAAIQDLAGNKAILSRVTADLGLQIDTKAPTVTKVLGSPSTGDLNAGNTVAITLDLSEPVTVKGTPTLSLNDGGIATYNLAASTSTSLVFDYLVSAGENTTALQVTGVNLVAGAAIQDLAGNNANLAGAAANLHLTIDTTSPTVTKVVSLPSSGEVTTGHTARITLDMSEPVTVSGAPTLLLNDGGTATYDAAHSTPKALAFDHMPSSGQVTTDLMVSGIELASTSSIQDLAGNNASLAGGGANLGLGINAKPSGTAGPSGGNLAISGSQELELFGASVANVTLGGDSSGILKLDISATFAGTVAGLASGNFLDLADLPYRGNNAPAYNPTGPNTGTLAVTERTSTINIALLGNYMANSFVASSDGHGGTVVSEPPLSESQFLTTPHT